MGVKIAAAALKVEPESGVGGDAPDDECGGCKASGLPAILTYVWVVAALRRDGFLFPDEPRGGYVRERIERCLRATEWTARGPARDSCQPCTSAP